MPMSVGLVSAYNSQLLVLKALSGEVPEVDGSHSAVIIAYLAEKLTDQ